MLRLSVLVVSILSLAACTYGCPTMGEGFDVSYELERDIAEEVSPLLLNPGSYEARTYHSGGPMRVRHDGSQYYGSIRVSMTADNMFGGRVPGSARVYIREDSDGQCIVRSAELLE